jgi:HK97 family phage portal protein
MGIRSYLKNLRGEKRGGNPLDNPSVSLASPAIWAWINQGNPSASGELVNEVSALQVTTVYACVRTIAESIASLPLKLYERLPKGRQEAADAPLYDLLAYEPNPEMTAFSFVETLSGCLALTGNCFAQIVRNGAGQPSALYPLHPLKTTPVRLPDGSLAYKTSDGETLGSARVLSSDDVLHVPLFCFDGLKGLSPIQQARETIGLSRAAEKFGARFFGNGSRPSGVLSSESDMDEQQQESVRESWAAANAGVNQNRTAVLPGKWTYQQIGLSPEDSQFLATRQFQRTDIAALFRVPSHMVGDTSRLSNSNHEQQSLQFVTDTLRPYLCRFEQEIIRKLLPDTGRNSGRYFVQFDVRERLRGDFATTMQGFATGKQWGWYTTNMILEDLGENPVGPEGDVLWAPVNMTNAKNLVNPSAPPTPDQSERAILSQYAPAFISLFRDAVGRATARTQRSIDSLSAIFTPLLVSISAVFIDAARAQFSLTDTWNPATDKLIREHLKSIEKRAAGWTADKADEITGLELQKAVRALHINIYRDAGAAVALLPAEVSSNE